MPLIPSTEDIFPLSGPCTGITAHAPYGRLEIVNNPHNEGQFIMSITYRGVGETRSCDAQTATRYYNAFLFNPSEIDAMWGDRLRDAPSFDSYMK